jgi:hypothetical protein
MARYGKNARVGVGLLRRAAKQIPHGLTTGQPMQPAQGVAQLAHSSGAGESTDEGGTLKAPPASIGHQVQRQEQASGTGNYSQTRGKCDVCANAHDSARPLAQCAVKPGLTHCSQQGFQGHQSGADGELGSAIEGQPDCDHLQAPIGRPFPFSCPCHINFISFFHVPFIFFTFFSVYIHVHSFCMRVFSCSFLPRSSWAFLNVLGCFCVLSSVLGGFSAFLCVLGGFYAFQDVNVLQCFCPLVDQVEAV